MIVPTGIIMHTVAADLRVPGLLGARLRGGDGRLNGGGIGDALLVNPPGGVYACGDSSDREPLAAMRFLQEFDALMGHFRSEAGVAFIGGEHWDDLRRMLTARIQRLLANFPFQGTTTFTGLMFLKGHGGIRGLLFHTGDSMVLLCRRGEGIRRLTEPNFWLLGKVRRLYQVDYFTVQRGDRLLMATDGIHDLTPSGERDWETYLGEILEHHPVAMVPDELIGQGDGKQAGRDDLALLALDVDCALAALHDYPGERG